MIGRVRGIAAASLSLAAAPWLNGCSGLPKSGTPVESLQVEAVVADSSSEVTPEALALAEQARRDVEQLQALRDQPIGAPADGPPPGPPEIQWILRPPASATAPAYAAQAPLANALPSRPASTPESPPPKTPPPPKQREAAAGPTGPELTGGPRVRQLIVELSGELYRQAAYSDMPLRELLLIAATTLITPDRELAPQALPGLTDRERELLALVQTFFAGLGRQLDSTGDPETVVEAVSELHRSLADDPQLQLPVAALCTQVRGFGDYHEFPRNPAGHYAFLAHQEQQIVVYIEIEDFSSELNQQGQWVTQLSQQLVVYDDRDGIPVWREPWQAGVDATKNRRDDFWMVQLVTLPAALSVGRYQLKVRIRDDKSGAEAETALDFEMVADARLTPAATH